MIAASQSPSQFWTGLCLKSAYPAPSTFCPHSMLCLAEEYLRGSCARNTSVGFWFLHWRRYVCHAKPGLCPAALLHFWSSWFREAWGDSRLLDLSSSKEPCATGNVCFLHSYPFPVASLDHGGNDSLTVGAEAPGSVPHCYTSLHGS